MNVNIAIAANTLFELYIRGVKRFARCQSNIKVVNAKIVDIIAALKNLSFITETLQRRISTFLNVDIREVGNE